MEGPEIRFGMKGLHREYQTNRAEVLFYHVRWRDRFLALMVGLEGEEGLAGTAPAGPEEIYGFVSVG
jgi:hypothetical protein